MAAMGPLVSEAPRPSKRPSTMSPLNGSIVIPRAGTVSRCGANRIVVLAAGGLGNKPSTLGLPAATYSNSTDAPWALRNSPTNRPIASSPALSGAPEGFSLGIRTRARHNSVTDSIGLIVVVTPDFAPNAAGTGAKGNDLIAGVGCSYLGNRLKPINETRDSVFD